MQTIQAKNTPDKVPDTNGMKIRLVEANKSAFLASEQRFRLLNFMAFVRDTFDSPETSGEAAAHPEILVLESPRKNFGKSAFLMLR